MRAWRMTVVFNFYICSGPQMHISPKLPTIHFILTDSSPKSFSRTASKFG